MLMSRGESRKGPAQLPHRNLTFSRNKSPLLLDTGSSALLFIFLKTDSKKLQGRGLKKNRQRLQALARAPPGVLTGTPHTVPGAPALATPQGTHSQLDPTPKHQQQATPSTKSAQPTYSLALHIASTRTDAKFLTTATYLA